MAALDAIMGNMPVANQRRQQQAQAATDLQLQQAIAAVPPKQARPAVAQTLGAGAAQQAGAAQVQQAQQGAQVAQQAGDMAIQQKKAELQENMETLRRGQDTTQLADEQQLANLNERAKQELFDNRMQFQKDQQGREFLNDRQLADYAVTHARDTEQLRDYAQTQEQLHDRKMQLLEVTQKKLEQELQFQQSLSAQKQDQALKQRLVQAKRDTEERIAREKARKANRAGKISLITGLLGGAVGGIATGGNPSGISSGMATGSAVGAGGAAATE